jgi:HAD superfamily hydrolase (TIGR01549 family)
MTPSTTPPVKAVLFDLDDTLFDHRHSSHASLEALRSGHPCFQQSALTELEQFHRDILEEVHLQVLAGAMSLHEARIIRMQRLFAQFGQDIPYKAAEEIAAQYRNTYQSSRQPVQGAVVLLEALRQRARIGIVSNNLLLEQRDKLDYCKLAPLIDVLVVSEEVGASKPDPHIFHVVLERLDCKPSDVVMIGDSWSADVLGATQLGIRSIWLNRYSLPCPDPSLAVEITSLEPAEALVELILG